MLPTLVAKSTTAQSRLGFIKACKSYSTSNTVGIVGVPFYGGQPKGGVDLGPKALRDAGLSKGLKDLGWKVKDHADVSIPEKDTNDVMERVKNPKWVGSTNKALSAVVADICKENQFPLVLGGDHSIAVGTISGMAKKYPDIGIIWVDAHADINDTGTSDSGNLHGMPLSFLLGLTDTKIPGFEWIQKENPVLKRDQIVYIGLRDVDSGERDYLNEHYIKYFDMHDVDKYGINTVMEMACKSLGDRPIHLSFDIDSLDPSHAPSTGTAVNGGLTFREGAYICEFLHDTGNLVSMELVEVNPTLAKTPEALETTVNSALSMIRCAMGETITWRKRKRERLIRERVVSA